MMLESLCVPLEQKLVGSMVCWGRNVQGGCCNLGPIYLLLHLLYQPPLFFDKNFEGFGVFGWM
jgi:hypothetical protein